MPQPLILASTSPYRAALLRRLGLPFDVAHPGIAEDHQPGEAPPARALRLALAKTQAVANLNPGSWVLGSDQVADCGGRVLDKPGTAERCREQLAACSGRAVTFYTAAVLMRDRRMTPGHHVDRTIVQFRNLSATDIASYVARDRPLDCAGGFRCEGLGIALFERIDSADPTALIGLPLIWVARTLRDAGLDPLAASQA